jgi:hypothetical protein
MTPGLAVPPLSAPSALAVPLLSILPPALPSSTPAASLALLLALSKGCWAPPPSPAGDPEVALASQPTAGVYAPSVPRSSTEKYLVFIAALLWRLDVARAGSATDIEDRRLKCHKSSPVASSDASARLDAAGACASAL